MLELLIIIIKLIYRFILRILCHFIYLNHNYRITEISSPYTDGFVCGSNYYDFELTYKCRLCGKVRNKLYYRDVKQWGRGIDELEIVIIDNKIEKLNNGMFVIGLENDDNVYSLKYLFKHSGIYKIKNTSKELKEYIDRFGFMSTKIYGDYLYVAVIKDV